MCLTSYCEDTQTQTEQVKKGVVCDIVPYHELMFPIPTFFLE